MEWCNDFKILHKNFTFQNLQVTPGQSPPAQRCAPLVLRRAKSRPPPRCEWCPKHLNYKSNSEETQRSRLEREKNTIQTTQDVSSFSNYARHSKHRKRLQSISIRVKILQTNPGSTTSGEELGPKGTLHSLDRFPRTRPQNKTSIPQSPSWKQGWLSCFCGFNMMPLEPKMLNRTQVRSLRKRHATSTSMQKWSAFKV